MKIESGKCYIGTNNRCYHIFLVTSCSIDFMDNTYYVGSDMEEPSLIFHFDNDGVGKYFNLIREITYMRFGR